MPDVTTWGGDVFPRISFMAADRDRTGVVEVEGPGIMPSDEDEVCLVPMAEERDTPCWGGEEMDRADPLSPPFTV